MQARQSIEETEWLLELAARDAWIAGVVGWVPLAGNAAETLKRFSANEKFRGVRHVLQGEPDAYFDRDDFNAVVALLRGYSLTYDVLIFERQLPRRFDWWIGIPSRCSFWIMWRSRELLQARSSLGVSRSTNWQGVSMWPQAVGHGD